MEKRRTLRTRSTSDAEVNTSRGESEQGPNKRRRSPNYTDQEVRVLMDLIVSHLETIENKKTDAETWRLKVLTWDSIAKSFNKVPGVIKRTPEMLRTKYDGMKKLARRKESRNREGSEHQAEFVRMEDVEVELLRNLEVYGQLTSEPKSACGSLELRAETLFSDSSESNANPEIDDNIEPPVAVNIDSSELEEESRFIITDDDMLWDLPDDNIHRPRMYLIKRQIEQLNKDEERKIKEHNLRIAHENMKINMFEIEHAKRMELLDLEIAEKKRALELDS